MATDIVVYPSKSHRFDDDPDTAADAWQRTLNWFDSTCAETAPDADWPHLHAAAGGRQR